MSRKLKTKQLKAIYLLASGITGVEVARQLKLRPETLSQWKKIPAFNEKFEQLMEEVRAGMQHRLTSLINASVSREHLELTNPYILDPKCVQVSLNVLKLLGIDKMLAPDVPKPEQK